MLSKITSEMSDHSVLSSLEAHRAVLEREVLQVEADLANVRDMKRRYHCPLATFRATPKKGQKPGKPSVSQFLGSTDAFLSYKLQELTQLLAQVTEQIIVTRNSIATSAVIASECFDSQMRMSPGFGTKTMSSPRSHSQHSSSLLHSPNIKPSHSSTSAAVHASALLNRPKDQSPTTFQRRGKTSIGDVRHDPNDNSPRIGFDPPGAMSTGTPVESAEQSPRRVAQWPRYVYDEESATSLSFLLAQQQALQKGKASPFRPHHVIITGGTSVLGPKAMSFPMEQ